MKDNKVDTHIVGSQVLNLVVPCTKYQILGIYYDLLMP